MDALNRPGPRVVRRWNLNETEGRYARTGIVESVIDLHLGLKRANGSKESVGHFELPLDALANRGFVTKRIVEGHRVFDVQIYREADGRFSLGVRQDETTPLGAYAIR
jgi:hypothetical protein